MDRKKAESSNGVTGEGLEVRKPRREGVSNPRYSPVVPKRMPGQGDVQNEAEYMEMGVLNIGYDIENEGKKMDMNSIDQKVKLDKRPIASGDSLYLAPASNRNGPSTTPKDPQYEDVSQVAAKVRSATATSSASTLPKRKANLIYEPAVIEKKRPLSVDHMDQDVPYWVRCALFVIGLLAFAAFLCCILLAVGSIKPDVCGCNGDTGSVQGSTGASTGVADSEWMKRLESNITELKQRIAPQEQQIVFLKNSTKENEKVINSLKEALELEQAKNRALNQTVKSYETRLNNEERKTSSHNQTLLQLRALHDALKNTTTSSTQSLAANIEEIDKRLQIVLSTMQGLNQTSRLDGIQSMIVEESQFRQSNDSALSQLIKENAMTRQQSIANLTADISTVHTASNQNIHNLEARLNSSINTKVAMLQTDDQTLFSQVSNVNQSILHMIRNISLTPGPQGPVGPAGPGNLTGCREESRFTETTSSTPVRASLTYDNVNRIVVGVLCHATLPAGIELYSVSSSEMGCKCNVPSASGATWFCWLRLWTCPKIS